MKKIKTILLALVLALGLGVNQAQAASLEEAILNIDASKYQTTIDLAKSYVKENEGKSKKATTDQLKALIVKSEDNLQKLVELQDRFRNKKRIKDQIRANLNNRNSYFTIEIKAYSSNKAISEMFLEVARENQYFFYGQYGSCKIDTSFNPSKSTEGKTYIEKASFDVTYRGDLALEYRLRNDVKAWINANIDPTMTEYGKVLAIHNYIVKKNYYNLGDKDGKSGGYSIYHPASILYGNGGVCNAYATLFDLMARDLGLETMILTGKSKRNGEDHMWNMVKVLGSWYHIDTTWDDPVIKFDQGHIENLGDFVIYDYFLKSDEEISKSRTIDEVKNRPQAPTSFLGTPTNSKIENINGQYMIVNSDGNE